MVKIKPWMIRTGIYCVNIIPYTLIKKCNVGNPIIGSISAGLDVACSLSDTWRGSKYVRLAKVAGAAYYAGNSVFDFFNGIHGNNHLLAQFAFDASLACQLGKDVFDLYRYDRGDFNFCPDRPNERNDLHQDIFRWGNEE